MPTQGTSANSLIFQGQEIDLSGADSTRIFNQQTKKWILLNENFNVAPIKKIFDLDLPVIPLTSLINYKKILSREVDLIDVEQLKNINEI